MIGDLNLSNKTYLVDTKFLTTPKFECNPY